VFVRVITYISLDELGFAAIFFQNFSPLIESYMTGQIKIVFEPLSSFEGQRLQILLALRLELIAHAVLSVHHLIDLPFVV